MDSHLTPYGIECKTIRNILADDEQYYGEYGKQFLSNSDINSLINTPSEFKKPIKQTKEMLLGSYFHTAILEPNKLKNFEVVDVANRRAKTYTEACSDGVMRLLSSEKIQADSWVDKVKNNLKMKGYIYHLDNLYEQPQVENIMGNMWKGKADIITNDYVIDLKTTTKIRDFDYKAKNFFYNSQAYIYQRLFNKEMLFFIIDKDTLQLQISPCSPQFIEQGKFKVEQATEQYNKFYGKNKTHEPNDFVIEKLL